MNKLLEVMFKRRGYTPSYLADINRADRGFLQDSDILADLLHDIHSKGEQIVVMPDFDMDGIMSGVIGYAGLSELGFNVALNIPVPRDGYGFDAVTIDNVKALYPDASAIISCDTGITCYDGVSRAKELGLKVLITDHHKEGDGELFADVVVDPAREADKTYGGRAICGAYVLYQCLETYAKVYQPQNLSNIERLRVFAGIATISDVMPLVYENRQIVKDAIQICRMMVCPDAWVVDSFEATPQYKRAFRGLHLVLDMYMESGTISRWSDIDEDFFGFYLAPMFNSVKRLDGDMDLAFGVFFGNTPTVSIEALYSLNESRKDMVKRYVAEIENQHNPHAPFVYISQAPAGILGLLATKLQNVTGVPTCVINPDNDYHGSGRSPFWYPALTHFKTFGVWCAGHEGAFGVRFTNELEIAQFVDALKEHVPTIMEATIAEQGSVKAEYDFVIATDGSGDSYVDVPMFMEFVRELKRYKPFGEGFSRPQGSVVFDPLDVEFIIMGKTKQHVKVILPMGLEVICWNSADLVLKLQDQKMIRVDGSFSESYYNDKYTLSFVGNFVLGDEYAEV